MSLINFSSIIPFHLGNRCFPILHATLSPSYTSSRTSTFGPSNFSQRIDRFDQRSFARWALVKNSSRVNAATCTLNRETRSKISSSSARLLRGRGIVEAIFSWASAQITPLGDVSPRKQPFCSRIFYLIASRLSCIALIRQPHRSSGKRGSWSGTTPATGNQ